MGELGVDWIPDMILFSPFAHTGGFHHGHAPMALG
jgi:hypothetical protein